MAAKAAMDTAGNEGEVQKGGTEAVVEWLKSNRLDKIIQYVEENSLVMDDFLGYTEDNMNEFLEDCKITAFAYKKKFKNAVRKLQFESNKNKEAVDAGVTQIYRVVMSAKESASMDVLKQQLSAIDASLSANTQNTTKLSKDTQETESLITNTFNQFREKLNERENILKNKLNEESNKSLNILKAQQTNLEKYKASIVAASKEQNELILDPDIDGKKREIKIDQITKTTMNEINNDDLKMDIAEIKFTVDANAVNKFVSTIGVVSGQPDPPTLNVSDIKATTAKIKLGSKHRKNLIIYQIKYKVDDDEKKENFQEINLNKNSDSTMLQNLNKNTKYSIYGRYKLLENSIWSRYSSPIPFTTLNYVSPPPTLTISNIKTTTAEIKLKSKYKKNLIIYQFKYKVDDDEKNENMKEITLNKNNDSQILENLKKNRKYSIYGRYKLLKDSIWSRYSSPISFTTLNYIPTPFQWDPSRKSHRITLSNGNKTAQSEHYSSWMTFVSKNVLNGNEIAKVEWEITFRSIYQNNAGTYLAFAMGYIEETAINSTNMDINIGYNHSSSIWLNGTYAMSKFNNGSQTYYDSKWKSNSVSNGSRLKLIFDFINKKSTFYFNDQLVGSLNDNLSDNIYPAATLVYQHTIETTKWNVESR